MPEPIATTDRGAVAGVATEHGFAFYGIPYAAPPFGPRRFQAPAVADSWTGPRPAFTPAPTAPQPATGFTLIPEPIIDGGDAPDCLVVNVFTPDLGAAGLPVLVWIHGGGFTNGTPSSTWYNGRRFARDGVVVVSVGYRLGAEGFLDIPGAPANRGVLDWIAALEWVQRNVASFGGDPARVTVGGQSAGGAAALLLTTLERARGLFRAAIPMSGSVFPAPSRASTGELTAKVAAALGCAVSLDDFLATTPAALVAAQIAATADASTSFAERALKFFPFVDDSIIVEPPMRAVGRGEIPLLIGATMEEFNPMAQLAPVADEAAALRAMGIASGSYDGGVGQAVTDRVFRVPAVRVAEARPGPTFHYDFRWRTAALGGLGAVHCLDLPFVWDVLDDPHVEVVAGGEPPQDLADTMHAAWVRFVTDGDAGWPAYRAPDRVTMVFDDTSKAVGDALAGVRELWA